MILRILLVGSVLFLSLAVRAESDMAALWNQRVKTVVAVEFFTETELDRRSTNTFGVVIDDQGTIVFPSSAINGRVASDQLKDFRIYLPGEPVTQHHEAIYLGHDEFTGWEFIRVENEELQSALIPVTDYQAAGTPSITDEIWGVGLRQKEENFEPYYMSSRVSVLQRLPRHTALTAQEVAGVGLPAYDRDGRFVGLTVGGFGQSFMQFSSNMRGGLPVVLVNPDESAAIVLAEEILPHLDRIPTSVDGRPLVWLGANGLQPLDPEVARYLQLENQAGLVISEVLEGSPAEAAGLKARDVILSLDGEPLPVLKPDRVLVTYFQREVNRRLPGDTFTMGVLRGDKKLDLVAVLTDAPRTPREASRQYFEKLGVTVREFTYADGVARRLKVADHGGVVAHFVKVNAPTSTSGLYTEDLIKEIDGVEVVDYDDAIKILQEIEDDETRSEFVLLVKRGGETAVLRVKLK